MQADWPVLSVLVWLPIAVGLLLLLAGDRNAATARWLALLGSVATFVVSLVLWRDFDTTTAAMQFVEREPWIGAFNAWYHLGVDGISMP
jgi:NADH-quinone oxidoreductase subunit M